MKPRVDIETERAQIHRQLARLWAPVLRAWADGIGTVTLRERETSAKDESRALRRRLSQLRQLERRRVSGDVG